MPTSSDQTSQLYALNADQQSSSPSTVGGASTTANALSQSQDDQHQQTVNQQGSRGSIAIGDTSARTAMGSSGGGGSGGGGSGGGGGGGGYSMGASLAAGPDTNSSGTYGDTRIFDGPASFMGKGSFGDFNVGDGQSVGMKSSTVIGLAVAGGLVVLGFAFLALRKGAA